MTQSFMAGPTPNAATPQAGVRRQLSDSPSARSAQWLEPFSPSSEGKSSLSKAVRPNFGSPALRSGRCYARIFRDRNDLYTRLQRGAQFRQIGPQAVDRPTHMKSLVEAGQLIPFKQGLALRSLSECSVAASSRVSRNDCEALRHAVTSCHRAASTRRTLSVTGARGASLPAIIALPPSKPHSGLVLGAPRSPRTRAFSARPLAVVERSSLPARR